MASGGYIANKYGPKIGLKSLNWKMDEGLDKVSHFAMKHLKGLDVYQHIRQWSKKADKHVNHPLKILTG